MRTLMLAAAAAIIPVLAGAAEPMSVGQREFMGNCASCHGADGKGNGPLAELLTVALPDLTQLQKNNDGVFPFEYLYRVIDGREFVGAHGTRDMPIWGNEYNEAAVEKYNQILGSVHPELFVSGRILSLTVYIQSIQER